MKSRYLFAAVTLVLTTLCAASAQQRVGYIDSQVLREKLPEFQDIQRQLEHMQLSFQQEARDRENKLQAKQESYTKQEMLMSEASKAAMQQQMEAEFLALRQYAEEKLGPEGELFRKNLELSSPIYKNVNDILKTIADEETYDLILDAAVGGVIVYANPKHDLTDKLIAKLLEQAATDSTQAEEAE